MSECISSLIGLDTILYVQTDCVYTVCATHKCKTTSNSSSISIFWSVSCGSVLSMTLACRRRSALPQAVRQAGHFWRRRSALPQAVRQAGHFWEQASAAHHANYSQLGLKGSFVDLQYRPKHAESHCRRLCLHLNNVQCLIHLEYGHFFKCIICCDIKFFCLLNQTWFPFFVVCKPVRLASGICLQ